MPGALRSWAGAPPSRSAQVLQLPQAQLLEQVRDMEPLVPHALLSFWPEEQAPSPAQELKLPHEHEVEQVRLRVPHLLPQGWVSLALALQAPSPAHDPHEPHLHADEQVRLCLPHLPQVRVSFLPGVHWHWFLGTMKPPSK